MIDINELRRLAADCYWPTSPVSINELIDRLEAAEIAAKDCLRIYGEKALIAQKLQQVETAWQEGSKACRYLSEKVIPPLQEELEGVKKERDELRAKISDLTINVEYLGNLKKSYEELIGELQEERDALRAKIEAMENQEPVDLNYIELMNSAQKIVESYVYFRRFIASTPLENDIAVWMADFVFAQLGAKGE